MVNQVLTENLPYLITEDGAVIEANSIFIELTGYLEQEIISCYISDVFSFLRITPKFDFDSLDIKQNCFILTKSLDYRSIEIYAGNLSPGRMKYIFSEKPNSRFEDKNPAMHKLLTDGHFGIGVFSSPDLTLIKANQAYLNLFDEPFNNREISIGLNINDLVDWTKVSRAKEIFMDIINTGNTFYGKEIKGLTDNRKSNYCDNTIIPVSEDGKVKYIISMVEDVTERVLNRQKIEEQAKLIEQQNRKLEAIVENMSDGLFILDEDGKFTFLNDGTKEFFYGSDSIKNAGDELVHSTYYDTNGKVIPLEQMPGHRVLRGEKIRAARVTVVRPDGTYHFDFSGSPIYNENGKVKRAVLCSRNVTEQVENENLIKFQKRQLETIVDNISEELCVFDKDRNYILLNKVCREQSRMRGLKNLNDYVGKYGYYDIAGNKIESKDMPSLRLMRGEVIRDCIYMAYDPDKRYLCTNGTPIFDENGSFIMGILSRKDVTGEMLYKKAIEQQLEILCQLIHNLDLPLLRISYPDLIITDINQKAFKMAQSMHFDIRSANCIKGNKITDFIPDFEKSYNYLYMMEAVREKKTKYRKDVISVMSGEELYCNIIYEPVLGVNGEIEEIIMILVDVTSEVRANKAMRKMLDQQEEFIANISHELKTPLNVIYSTIQLINLYCREGSLDEKRDLIIKHISAITQNCFRLSKLINNIVDLSKIEAGFYELNKSNHNIVDVVEETVMSVVDYTESKGLNIIFDTDTEEKIIACDHEKIERIMLNLISNAIKFSDAGDEICVSVSDKDDYVEISVKDNGTGIDKCYLDTIFDRFRQADKSFTRNAEGTGIGLSLVKSIVELHEGKISVESELGKGSKFTVLLPAGGVKSLKSLSDSNLMKSNKQTINIEMSDIY